MHVQGRFWKKQARFGENTEGEESTEDGRGRPDGDRTDGKGRDGTE
jgi:hypothetical protein